MVGTTESRSTRRREAPSGVRTHRVNGGLRESPTWRLRSKSTSHDNVLFRMGLRRDSNGDFVVPNNRVPAGLANAMRRMRIRSKSRARSKSIVKTEPAEEMMEVMEDVDVDMQDDVEFLGAGVGEEGADVMGESAVYGYEEIRIYLDVDRGMKGGHAYVNESGMKVETVMMSVEESAMHMVEEKEVPGSEGVERLDAGRDSLASVIEEDEEDEERIDVDSTTGPGRQRSSTDLVVDAANRPTKKRRIEWTDEEIRYVGAWSDAGFTRAAIIQQFQTRFPDRGAITKSTISAIRKWCSDDILHLQQSKLLGQKHGLVTGKWSRMTLALVQHTQKIELQTLMSKHKLELDQGNAALSASSNEQATLDAHSAMRHILVAQRAQTRDLSKHQYKQMSFDVGRDKTYQHYLAQLTILIHRSKTNSVVYQEVTKAYVLPIELEHQLNGRLSPIAGIYWPSIPVYEYDVAISLLEAQHGMIAEVDYHHEAMELLDFDKFISDHRDDSIVDLEKRGKEHQWRRMLHIQQDKRRRLFDERQKEGLLDENEAEPLEASKILRLILHYHRGDDVIDALLSSREAEKQRIEARVRAIEPDSSWANIYNAIYEALWEHRARMKENGMVAQAQLEGTLRMEK